ncbi:MAG TPA: asparaginase [Stellaceae bacterium]|nr:asparaginase [Stellaceae bacterium]
MTTRGEMLESRHTGAAAVVDAAGHVVRAWGDVDAPVFARSAIKPLQALPLVETGAADRLGLGNVEIALACASHRGEAMHVETIRRWLERADLGPEDLECGAHAPGNAAAAAALIRASEAPSALHNNCSGKHSGFLTTARHLGEPTRGYIAPEHPVQRRVKVVLEEMSGLDLARAPRGTDGCGIPVVGISLRGMARAMARLADPKGLSADRAAASKRILDAMAAAPLMVCGTGTFNSVVMTVAGSTVRLKTGAEGVYCAVLPGLGYGVALKIDDGASRASEVAVGAILDGLGAFSEAQRAALAPQLRPTIKNVAGREVGEIRPTETLTAQAH